MSRKTCCWILVLAAIGAGGWWLPGQRQAAQAPHHVPDQAARAAVAADPQAAAVLLPAPVGGESSPPGKRTAYRLALDGNSVRLLATDELQGDFHRRRGRLAWWPGMLYFRLLDSRQQVLAEETLAASEPTCVVLESALPGAAATPPPTAAIASASPLVFQVRLPSVAAAAQLQVYRLTGVRPAAASAELPAKLIGSLALQR